MRASTDETLQSLAAIPGLQVSANVPLALHTRFAIGGPAALLAETPDVSSFIAALGVARASGQRIAIIGGGSNLIAADGGFDGIVLRFTADSIRAEGSRVIADSGAELQTLVDFSIGRGLAGLETLTRLPGWVGAAAVSPRTCAPSVLWATGWACRCPSSTPRST